MVLFVLIFLLFRKRLRGGALQFPVRRRELLRDKVAATPLLKFNGAPIVEIDSTRPLADVLAAARLAVASTMADKGYELRSD